MERKPRHPALRRLDALVGEWEVRPNKGGTPMGVARTTFAWMEGAAYLIQRTTDDTPADDPGWVANSPLPATIIIGLDDSDEQFSALYADARDVFRVYQMRLSDGVWKQWRDAPGFGQRFTGTFSDDGATITAQWEFSPDGATWEVDFHLTYTKVK